MRPAGNFIDGAIAVQMVEPRVSVCLKTALEVLQMLPRVLALAIFRVREPDSRRGIFARGSVVAHISPETPGLGLAAARRKHRHRRIVGVKLGSGEHMLLNRIDQRSELGKLARDLDVFFGIHLAQQFGLQRGVVGEQDIEFGFG